MASAPSTTRCRRFVSLCFLSARSVSSASSSLSSTSRISTASSSIRSVLPRKREGDLCALPELALRLDPPAVTTHDPLHERKPHPGSLELGGGMQPLKHSEELARIPRVEA